MLTFVILRVAYLLMHQQRWLSCSWFSKVCYHGSDGKLESIGKKFKKLSVCILSYFGLTQNYL